MTKKTGKHFYEGEPEENIFSISDLGQSNW
jgi:hypothetical protein